MTYKRRIPDSGGSGEVDWDGADRVATAEL